MPDGWLRVSIETQMRVNMRSPCWHSHWSTWSQRGQSRSTAMMWMMITKSESEVMVTMAIKEEQGLIVGAMGGGGITAGLSVVHHAACLDFLTAQGEMEMDRRRQGESAYEWRERKMGKSGRKSGWRSRECVHRSLSAVCWHGSYGTPFRWHRHHVSTVGVLAHASVSTHACVLAPAAQRWGKGMSSLSSSSHIDSMMCVR